MKFLVLGCNGMAGHMISIYLNEQGHNVTGFARKESPYVKTIVGDAKDTKLLKKVIDEGQYDTVINAIGVLNRFAEENHENAVFLNSYLPQYLAKITEGTKIQIIHMSTDCVYCGDRGGYREHDFPDGKLFYDRSKALGEIDDGKNVTFRNSIVGPDPNPNGIGLVNWFLQQHDRVKGYKNAIWTGQTTLQLAKTMENASIQRIHGLYNMVPECSISKYDLLILFNKYLRNDSIEIVGEENFKIDKSLIRTNFEMFSYKIPEYEQQIIELGEWMRQHRELYPHYNL
jgi:dTDP-4-dehydrorhamnose reductase